MTNHSNTYSCEIITTAQWRRRGTQSFRKIYLSRYLKELCVRGSWRPNRTATYWPPLLWPSAFLSHSPGLFNRGPGAQPLWVLAFSTASYLQVIWYPNWLTSCLHPGYIIIWRPLFFLRASQFRTHSTRPRSRLYPDIPRPDAPVIYTVAFPILTASPGSICYTYVYIFKCF